MRNCIRAHCAVLGNGRVRAVHARVRVQPGSCIEIVRRQTPTVQCQRDNRPATFHDFKGKEMSFNMV